jgi:hypothetical protein
MTPEEFEAIYQRARAGDDESVRYVCTWCDFHDGDQRHCRGAIHDDGMVRMHCPLADHRKRLLEAGGKTEADMLTEPRP